MKIEIKSPTRVDLAGGTLDMWPLYSFIGGATTVNMAIDIFTHVELEVFPNDPKIEIESKDLGFKKVYVSYEHALKDMDQSMSLYKLQLKYWKPEFGFKLKTKSESPVGGGLGGSSSLLISLLKAFSQAKNKPFSSVHSMVELAHNLEAEQLLTPTGTQDYYPAISGGINILEYRPTGIAQELFNEQNEFKDSELSKRFLLVYTGRSHHSGMNNFEVLKNAVAKKSETIKSLISLKYIAEEMAAKVRAGRWSDLTSLFHREYEARVQLASAILSPEIEKLKEVALYNGAEAIKICGAGGGGCVMIWCPTDPSVKQKIADACTHAGFQVLQANPISTGH